MRYLICAFFLLGANVVASESLVYLTCSGVVTDTALDQEINKVKNDFLIDKSEKTIQQIITGLTEEQTANLRMKYVETPTQYVTENGMISINRRTLEYSVDGAMSTSINGKCEIAETVL